uniref:EB domain-containing protein n=1 Tax=Timema genevievae TaxID=629358 RepID=A0A7R9JXN1_TIMGE|nr:unnamed protein product [Timema genevievae]
MHKLIVTGPDKTPTEVCGCISSLLQDQTRPPLKYSFNDSCVENQQCNLTEGGLCKVNRCECQDDYRITDNPSKCVRAVGERETIKERATLNRLYRVSNLDLPVISRFDWKVPDGQRVFSSSACASNSEDFMCEQHLCLQYWIHPFT